MSMMDDMFGGGQGSAADDVSKGYQNSIDTYNKYLSQISDMFQPYMDQGKRAGNQMENMGNEQYGQYMNMMGGPGGDWMNAYTESPWAKYQTDVGSQSANASAAAGGMLGSGNNQRSVDTMSQGISSQDRQQYYNDMMGMGAAAQGNYMPLQQTGANMADQLGGYTYNTGQAVGGAQKGIGQANAAGDAANSSMWTNLIGTGAQIGGAAFGGPAGAAAGSGLSKSFTAGSDQEAMNHAAGWY